MSVTEILRDMRLAVENAPRNGYIAELHIQIIKHAHNLQTVKGREFCDALGIGPSFATEFSQMRKIAPRLRDAGLVVERL